MLHNLHLRDGLTYVLQNNYISLRILTLLCDILNSNFTKLCATTFPAKMMHVHVRMIDFKALRLSIKLWRTTLRENVNVMQKDEQTFFKKTASVKRESDCGTEHGQTVDDHTIGNCVFGVVKSRTYTLEYWHVLKLQVTQLFLKKISGQDLQ